MEKTKIPIIALAVFSILSLLAYGNIEKVFAITVTDITVSVNITGNYLYNEGDNKFIGITSGTDSTIQTIDADTHSITSNTITGVNTNTLGCSGSSCYTLVTNTLYQVNPLTGVVTNSATISMTSGATSVLSALQTSANYDIVQDGVLYIHSSCDSGNTVFVKFSTALAFLGYVGDCTGVNLGSTSFVPVGMIVQGTKLAVTLNNGASSAFQIWNTGGGRDCTTTVGDIFGSTGGSLIWHSGSSNWLVTTSSSQRVDRFNTSCSDVGDITSAQHGLTTALHGIELSSIRGEIYIQSTTNVAVMNYTTLTVKLYDLSCSSDTSRSSYAFSEEFDVYSCTSGTNVRLIDLDAVAEEEEEIGNQQDGFCGNGTLRDCMGDSNALSGLVPANENITSVGTTICQGIGLCSPDDENPRTNGTGLFLMLITGSFFAIALMSTVHTLNMRGYISASVKEIDPIFWLFLVVGTVSVAWYLDWIDDIIFAAMTVGLAGLVAFGVLKHFGRI